MLACSIFSVFDPV